LPAAADDFAAALGTPVQRIQRQIGFVSGLRERVRCVVHTGIRIKLGPGSSGCPGDYPCIVMLVITCC
jgi:hypothetical protein